MVGMLSSQSTGDRMKRKTRDFMESANIIPISIFSSTDASELQTGYSDIKQFDLDMVVLWKEDRYHLFSEEGNREVNWVFGDNQMHSMHLDRLPEFIEGSYLVGYDLESFGIPLLKDRYKNLAIQGSYDLMKSAFDAYGEYTGEGGKRFKLFDLAFWNSCEHAIGAMDIIGFSRMKMISDWAFGHRRNTIKHLKNEVLWCSQLAHRIFRRPELYLKDYRTGKKKRMIVREMDVLG